MTVRKIAAISAGLGQPSSSRMLVDRMAEATVADLAHRGIMSEVHVLELRTMAIDVVNASLTGFPSVGLRDELEFLYGADALIAVSPIYTTSYTGLFKSFVDILDPDALGGLPVALGATGGTARHSLALDYAMRPLFTYLHANVVPTSVYAATDDWASLGEGTSPLHLRVERTASELASAIAAGEPRVAKDDFTAVPSFADMMPRQQRG